MRKALTNSGSLALLTVVFMSGCGANLPSFSEQDDNSGIQADEATTAEEDDSLENAPATSGLVGDVEFSTTSQGNAPQDCNEEKEDAALVPAHLLFVVDKSGSMECNAPPIDSACLFPEKVEDGEPSKWQLTQAALTGSDGALQVLAGQAGVSAGLLTFPTDNFCALPEDAALSIDLSLLTQSHVDALAAGLAIQPAGETPFAGAAINGLEALRRGIHEGDIDGNPYLVILTDGAETCQVSALDDLLDSIDSAFQDYGIRTYAIGAPGSEDARNLLSELAVLGGTAVANDCSIRPLHASASCHIDLTESQNFGEDLGRVFRNITQATTQTCEFDVPANSLVDLGKVNVEYTLGGEETVLVPRDPAASGQALCEGAEGWQFNATFTKIHLCGEFCSAVLTDPNSEVEVVFGCRNTVVR
ncbi:MAG: VWA domain-containing protein [Polyangiaceae bacterium]|nr:VWA domain-containing protein [Polyangiaceae bacterium]